MTEQQIQQHIRIACSRGPVRLWRNNVGALRDENGRLVRYGLCPGSADLIGLQCLPSGLGRFVARGEAPGWEGHHGAAQLAGHGARDGRHRRPGAQRGRSRCPAAGPTPLAPAAQMPCYDLLFSVQ
jgi:hypothetical protein